MEGLYEVSPVVKVDSTVGSRGQCKYICLAWMGLKGVNVWPIDRFGMDLKVCLSYIRFLIVPHGFCIE